MRDWKTLPINCTTREVIENFNKNTYSSMFLDYVTGTIMNNGLLFTGKETIAGTLISPLVNSMNNAGVVQSDTIFDNFRMYFRKDNEVIELNNFPVDLTAFTDNEPHFLYFKQDKSYRVSNYIFGQADEVLIGRFIIGTDSRWRQFYIMAQRAGTPMYSSGEEFYDVDGIYVKSPGGLELSHTDGYVKRSGIEFTDPFSPDLLKDSSTSEAKVPIRYVNEENKIDYDVPVVYEVDPNKYMNYNFDSKKKTNAQERIRNLFNATFNIVDYANEMADALAHALTITTDHTGKNEDLVVYINDLKARLLDIYVMVGDLGSYLSDNFFKSIDKTRLNQNIQEYNAYTNNKLTITPSTIIDSTTVQIMRDSAYLIAVGKASICADPLDLVLRDMYDAIGNITVAPGKLVAVPTGKHTIQRVLWDIYEQCFIMQYGDKVYDTFEDALEEAGEVLYPVPFGRLLYIPLAIFIVKQGTTDINTDTESIIITKKVVYADSEQEGFADYIARAMANKALDYIYGILDGTYPANKADSLKHTDSSGRVVYDDGDFFLNYDNLRNRVTIVNNLTESTYNNKHALSAYQGYILNQNKLARDGSQPMTGTLQARSIVPTTADTYDLGSSTARWRKIWAKDIDAGGNVNIGGTLTSNGLATLKNGASVTGNVTATGNISAGGNASVTGTLNVTGNTTLKNITVSNLTVTGDTNLKAINVTSLTATGTSNLKATNIDGALSVSGNTSLKNVTVDGMITTKNGAQFVVTGPTKKTAVRLEADSKANINAAWSGYQNGTVAICW